MPNTLLPNCSRGRNSGAYLAFSASDFPAALRPQSPRTQNPDNLTPDILHPGPLVTLYPPTPNPKFPSPKHPSQPINAHSPLFLSLLRLPLSPLGAEIPMKIGIRHVQPAHHVRPVRPPPVQHPEIGACPERSKWAPNPKCSNVSRASRPRLPRAFCPPYPPSIVRRPSSLFFPCLISHFPLI